jgi:hypothetical protein
VSQERAALVRTCYESEGEVPRETAGRCNLVSGLDDTTNQKWDKEVGRLYEVFWANQVDMKVQLALQ